MRGLVGIYGGDGPASRWCRRRRWWFIRYERGTTVVAHVAVSSTAGLPPWVPRTAGELELWRVASGLSIPANDVG